MKNIFYHKNIIRIGGIETFLYEIAKIYQDLDITILYQEADPEQLKRLKKYVRVKKYNGEKIKCEKFYINYVDDISENIEAKEYIRIIHADYKAIQLKPIINPKVSRYIAVSKQAAKSFEELTGIKCDVVYNPIQIDKPKRVLNLISATRLTAEKGRNRMIKLAKILDEANIPYIWTIFTNDTNIIDNPNVIYMKPRLDIINYIANADYLVQLSDNEGYCYSIVESLCVGTPVIVTDCPVFNEIGVKNGENGFILDFDLNNININDIYEKRLKFEYEPLKNNWNKILAKGESEYKKDLKILVDVKCINDFYDIENNLELRTIDDKPFKVNKVRAEELEEKGFIEIIK